MNILVRKFWAGWLPVGLGVCAGLALASWEYRSDLRIWQERLRASAQARAAVVEAWVSDNERAVAALAEAPAVRTVAEQREATGATRQLLDAHAEGAGYLRIAIADSRGKVVLLRGPRDMGAAAIGCLERALEGHLGVAEVDRDLLRASFCAPVTQGGKHGTPIGAVLATARLRSAVIPLVASGVQPGEGILLLAPSGLDYLGVAANAEQPTLLARSEIARLAAPVPSAAVWQPALGPELLASATVGAVHDWGVIRTVRRDLVHTGTGFRWFLYGLFGGAFGLAFAALLRSLQLKQELSESQKSFEVAHALARSQEMLLEADQRARRLTQLIDHLPHEVFVVEPETLRVSLCNRSAQTRLGLSMQDVAERSLGELWDAQDRAPLESLIGALSASLPTASMESEIERSPGGRVPVLVRASWVETNGTPSIVIVVADNSREQRLKEQLEQSARLESLGRLASGIAHDFNNMLTAIIAATEFLSESCGTEGKSDIELIRSATDRATQLTRQLLAYGRRQILQPAPVCLNDVLLGVEPMLRRLLPENIDIKLKCAGDLGTSLADAAQFEQAIVNLAINARDAMPQGGRLTIESSNCTLDDEYARQHPDLEPGDFVLVAVSDTGSGMDAETRRQIFEPFFTTKGHCGGTGLGLATVLGMVRQSGGHLFVYSELGQGSTFKIYMPVTTTAPAAAPTLPEVSTSPAAEDQHILVVEDDDTVRELTARTLARAGYSVTTAANGPDALQRCREQAFDLLLSDVVMPGMGGRVLYEQIRIMQPSLRVLYMSGFTDNAIVQHGVLQPGTHFLQKPFSTEGLSRAVQAALAGSNAAASPGKTPTN